MNQDYEVYVESLRLDHDGDWNWAHELIQDINSAEASWIHAYLHRKEGDEANARYWYRQAGRDFNPQELEVEWQELWDHFSN